MEVCNYSCPCSDYHRSAFPAKLVAYLPIPKVCMVLDRKTNQETLLNQLSFGGGGKIHCQRRVVFVNQNTNRKHVYTFSFCLIDLNQIKHNMNFLFFKGIDLNVRIFHKQEHLQLPQQLATEIVRSPAPSQYKLP